MINLIGLSDYKGQYDASNRICAVSFIFVSGISDLMTLKHCYAPSTVHLSTNYIIKFEVEQLSVTDWFGAELCASHPFHKNVFFRFSCNRIVNLWKI